MITYLKIERENDSLITANPTETDVATFQQRIDSAVGPGTQHALKHNTGSSVIGAIDVSLERAHRRAADPEGEHGRDLRFTPDMHDVQLLILHLVDVAPKQPPPSHPSACTPSAPSGGSGGTPAQGGFDHHT